VRGHQYGPAGASGVHRGDRVGYAGDDLFGAQHDEVVVGDEGEGATA
jgi:hypothetical protein